MSEVIYKVHIQLNMAQPPPQDPAPAGDPIVSNDDTPDKPASTSNSQSAPATSRTSSFSSVRSTSLQHKSKHAEPGVTEVHADHASLSMPPPQSRRVRHPRPSLPHSRRASNTSEPWNEETASARSRTLETSSLRSPRSPKDVAAASNSSEDFETPRLVPGASADKVDDQPLPEPAMPSSRSSFSESDNTNKRMSVSSIYSLASARGIPSSAASANGSDTGSTGTPRSVSGFMAASVGKQSDTGVSNVTVTAGSQGSASGSLTLREQHHHLPDILKRNHGQVPRSDPSSAPRPQASRDRSRAKRRLSSSTAASSHSPSSDRTLHHKEKEEGLSVTSPSQTVRSLTEFSAKPAPLGLIGVCALDIKARSKPSRNILNRLLANREFDVKIFGDKVILDEGMEPDPIRKYHH